MFIYFCMYTHTCIANALSRNICHILLKLFNREYNVLWYSKIYMFFLDCLLQKIVLHKDHTQLCIRKILNSILSLDNKFIIPDSISDVKNMSQYCAKLQVEFFPLHITMTEVSVSKFMSIDQTKQFYLFPLR